MINPVVKLERDAARNRRELIAIIGRTSEKREYIVLGSIVPEFEELNAAELAALRNRRGDLLVVRLEE